MNDGELIPASVLTQPSIEAELAFAIGRDDTVRNPGELDVLDAIDYALPALEIVGNRIAKSVICITDTIADNASSSGFVMVHGTTRRRTMRTSASR